MPRARARRRAHRLAAALAVPGLVVVLTVPASAATAPADPSDACPAGEAPGVSTGAPRATDDGVAVLVGGDYTALPGTKESEGVLAVVGDVRVATQDRLNVGRAGGGSQIVPPAGTAMLVAGGTIDATGSVVDVGHGIVGPDASGGDVVAGGAILPADAFETNGGALLAHGGEEVAAELGPLRDALVTLGADLAALPATGTSVLSGDLLTLTAAGAADVHVFDVRAQDLAAARSVLYVGTGSAPVVVDVAGPEVDYRVLHTAVDHLGARVDDPSGAAIGAVASRTLWNLAGATHVELGDGTTTSQLVGSVLVPDPGSVVLQRTHTNGRMWVGGDLTVGGPAGLEHHSYPWVGEEDEPPCAPSTTSPAPTDDPGRPDEPEPTEPAEPAEPTEPVAPPEPAAPEGSVEVGGRTPPPAGERAAPVARTLPAPQTGRTPRAERLATTGVAASTPLSAAAVLVVAGAALLVVSGRRRATR
ncbi:choice-of-anchor A family protein, partial [Cellulosimicrobium cellulans]|uniref:choice-of-anchor A family protein n=1 Tax=Cellulosimicrobium cellulans TaxID=1710 RepID=UPI000848E337